MSIVPRRKTPVDTLVENDRLLRAYWTRGSRIFNNGMRGFSEDPLTLVVSSLWTGGNDSYRPTLYLAGDLIVVKGHVAPKLSGDASTAALTVPLDYRPADRTYGEGSYRPYIEPDGSLKFSFAPTTSGFNHFTVTYPYKVAP